MGISLLSISQDNIVDGSDLMPVHSPLRFLCQATYSGDTPEYIYVDLYDDLDALQETFRAIPYRDISTTVREFVFIAEALLRQYMEDFDDFAQAGNTLVYCDGITKRFKLVFRDPDGVAIDETLYFNAMHGASQFGEYPNKESLYDNNPKTYYNLASRAVYAYYYNNDEANVITVDGSTIPGATEIYDEDFSGSLPFGFSVVQTPVDNNLSKETIGTDNVLKCFLVADPLDGINSSYFNLSLELPSYASNFGNIKSTVVASLISAGAAISYQNVGSEMRLYLAISVGGDTDTADYEDNKKTYEKTQVIPEATPLRYIFISVNNHSKSLLPASIDVNAYINSIKIEKV